MTEFYTCRSNYDDAEQIVERKLNYDFIATFCAIRHLDREFLLMFFHNAQNTFIFHYHQTYFSTV